MHFLLLLCFRCKKTKNRVAQHLKKICKQKIFFLKTTCEARKEALNKALSCYVVVRKKGKQKTKLNLRTATKHYSLAIYYTSSNGFLRCPNKKHVSKRKIISKTSFNKSLF